MKTNIGLVDFMKQALAAHLGYVYGAHGEICTIPLLDKYKRLNPANNLAGGRMYTVGKKWLGRRVVDCSGVIKYYLMADKVGDEPKYDSKYDCFLFGQAKVKGTIDTLPETPGTCLYMPGHTAVYIGNGQAIESGGTAIGVVQTSLKSRKDGRKWTHWYQAPFITYLQTVKTQFKDQPFSLDTASKDMGIYQRYTVLARCSDKPTVQITGADKISVSEPYVDAKGRGYMIDVVGKAKGFAHITVSAGGIKKQCNFNIK